MLAGTVFALVSSGKKVVIRYGLPVTGGKGVPWTRWGMSGPHHKAELSLPRSIISDLDGWNFWEIEHSYL